MRKLILAVALVAAAIGPARALERFTITDIRVEGLQRISAGTVFNYLPLKVGDVVDDAAAQDAIRTLFKTGFFDDIELDRDGDVLVVSVRERPSIASIDFRGNREFKTKDLEEPLRALGLVVGRVFNDSTLDAVVQDLKSQYFSRGRYSAEVEPTVTPLERNRVAIVLDFDEGEVARIKRIKIVGNQAFEEKDLLDEFKLSTRNALQFFSKKDRYSKPQLSADLESLTSFYQDQGYLDFEISSAQVSITPDKQDIFITVSVAEGEQYVVDEVRLGGNTVIAEQELMPLVVVEAGEIFSRRAVSETRAALASRLADEGYAFSNVNAVPDIDREARTVSFDFIMDPGRRVYVRRINITGNVTTRDEVIRREMRQFEGAFYSASKIRRSRIRLQRLGFFSRVDVDTPAVAGTNDQVDLNVDVEERPTGSFLFGVGYSDADGVLLQASISQENLFGTGKVLSVNIDNSSVTRVYELSFRNPYHTPEGVSRGFVIERREVDAREANTADYILDTNGAALNYRFPISEFHTFSLGVGAEQIRLEETERTPAEFSSFIDENPDSTVGKLDMRFARDTRDSIVYPFTGSFQRASVEVSAGDLDYYKFGLRGTWFMPLSANFTFKAFGDLGYGASFGDSDDLPFFENFFAGGPNSVRGYDSRSLGPQDSGPTPESIGGDVRVLVNAELLFPFPGSQETRDKRLSLFVDGGQVYESDEDVDLAELRYSAGLGFSWFSPVGPLAISYAVPLNDEPGDQVENVQFTLGTLFR